MVYGQHSSTSVDCDFYPSMDQRELKESWSWIQSMSMQMGIKELFVGLQNLCNMDFECFFGPWYSWCMFGPSIYVLHSLWVGIKLFLCLFMTPFLTHSNGLGQDGDYEQPKNKPNTQRRFHFILVFILVFPLVFGLS
jgi:hypothetical protein